VRSDPADRHLQWFKTFLLLWAAQHKVSERAMDHLMQAQGMSLAALRAWWERGDAAASDAPVTWPRRFASLRASVSDDEEEEEGGPDPEEPEAAAARAARTQRRHRLDRGFVRYAMCPADECGQLYTLEEAALLHEGRCSRKLSEPIERPAGHAFPPFVDARNKAKGALCGTVLMHQECGQQEALGVLGRATSAPRFSQRPLRMYPYRGVTRALRQLFRRPGFEQSLEHWRPNFHRPATSVKDEQLFFDIYDGSMWKEYQTRDGKPLLSEPYVLALGLNVAAVRLLER